MEKIYWAVLQMAQGIGSARLRKLMDYFESGETAWRASERDLRLSGCLDQSSCTQLSVLKSKQLDIEGLAKSWEKKGIRLCTYADAEYPEKLKNIFNPPALLYYRGSIGAAEKRIAVVGARKASPYGKNVAKNLGAVLAKSGVEVVSGAARGIDTAAHMGALEAAGRTTAVLGCGIDIVYPPENRNLLDQIAEQGLVVSEYAPGTAVNAKFFPARNRIISGLSDGIVVVEAALKSGALITAEFALNEGRDVFAVPGSIFSEASRGCHRLIKQGAKLVDQAEDILEEYRWNVPSKPRQAADIPVMSEEEAAVYRVLSDSQPLAVDEIILKTRSDVSNITLILLQMELRGLIAEQGAHCYVRAMKEDVL